MDINYYGDTEIWMFQKFKKSVLSMPDIVLWNPRSQYAKKSPNADWPLIWSYHIYAIANEVLNKAHQLFGFDHARNVETVNL